MSQVIRVSKAGFDAGTTTAPDDLNYSSDYNTLKYYMSGTVNVTTSGSDAETNVSHNLGYIPFFVSYVNKYAEPTGVSFNMCPGFVNDFGNYDYSQSYADTSKIYFKVYTNNVSSTFTFRYFVFRNNLNL